MSVDELRACLASLQKQAQTLRARGAIPYPDFKLDSSENVPGSGMIYYRKRFKPGVVRASGKRSEVISKKAYQQLQQQLKDGRRLKLLEQQIRNLVQQLDQAVAVEQQRFSPGAKIRFWVMKLGVRMKMSGVVVCDKGSTIEVAAVLSNGLSTISIASTQVL